MKPTLVFNRLSKVAILLTAAIFMPLFLSAQSKKTAPAPPAPPPKAAAPAPAPQQHPVQQQAQPHPANPQQRQGGSTGTNGSHSGTAASGNTGTNGAHGRTTATGSAGANGGHGGNKPTGTVGTNGVKGGIGSGGNTKATKASSGNVRPNSVPQHIPPVHSANGNSTYADTATHRQWETNKTGQVTHFSEPGRDIRFGSNGKPTYLHDEKHGVTITQSPTGVRRVESQRVSVNGEHYRVVSTGPNHGYVQHTFQRGGQEYMRRTYVVGGRTYVNVYRPYSYHGAIYYHYVPAYYYRPAFYGWGYNPWGAPVVYTGWGWYGSPWYASYGYYFAPYSAYPSAAFWLTDYLIAENLQAAYAAGVSSAGGEGNSNAAVLSSEGQSGQSGPVILTPEVKAMIAEEVKAQLAAEQAAATQQGNAPNAGNKSAPQRPAPDADQVPPALDPTLRVFIVATNLNVTADGQSCSLTPGDVLMRTENKEDADHTVGVNVVSSKKSDCITGSSSRVQVADLQEMHNHFREQMDTGLKTLADNQGKNGIPSGPAANPRENPDGRTAIDLTAVADLQKQQQDAEQAEKEVQQASAGNGNGQ